MNMEMIRKALVLLGKKSGTALIQVFIVASIVFSFMHILPGDPVLLLLGQESNPDPAVVAAMRHQLGLDQPIFTQYVVWFGQLVQFDFGMSITDNYPVLDYLRDNLPRTLELALASILVATLIGVPLGMVAAIRRGTWTDTALTSLATVGISLPVYILGSIFIIVFSLQLGWLPSSGYTDLSRNVVEHFRKLALPSFTLGLGLAASIARMTRSSVLEIMERDFVRALRAKGMSERRVIWQHVLRNAAIPVVTIIGLQLGNLMGGTVLVEALFNWPGLSTLLVESVGRRNYPLVQGCVLTISALFIIINLGVEVLYGLLDPRIRQGKS
jgi:peptide/nickel transport system permease protein